MKKESLIVALALLKTSAQEYPNVPEDMLKQWQKAAEDIDLYLLSL